MVTAEIRELLERTGDLHTKTVDDPGYVSSLWRSTIDAMCAVIDESPVSAAVQLRREKSLHAVTTESRDAALEEIDILKAEIANSNSIAAANIAFARRLIEEATPRMRSLNNQMSPGWLARAGDFLGSN